MPRFVTSLFLRSVMVSVETAGRINQRRIQESHDRNPADHQADDC